MLGRDQSRDEFPGRVVFKKPTPGEWPHYELPDNQLSHGASLGNRKIWVETKPTGSIERVFCNAIGMNLVGSIVVTYAVPCKLVVGSSPEPGCLASTGAGYVVQEPDGPGTMSIYPFRQVHSFDLSGELHLQETVLVPKVEEDDPPSVLQHIKVTNGSGSDVTLLVTVYANVQGDTGDDLKLDYDEDLGVLSICNGSRPELARLVGLDETGAAYRVSQDVSQGYAGTLETRISDDRRFSSGPAAQLQMELKIKAGESVDTSVTVVVSHTGIEDAKKWYGRCSSFHDHARTTTEFLGPIASTSIVETPDPIINQGVFWAKVNMLRVIADYPEGPAFTNEPGKSSNIVGRDVAWYVYGCDYLVPRFSRKMLVKFAEKQYPSGKIPEYYNALDGHVEDYGLSINDDTPLFVLACCHHYSATKDRSFLEKVYPSMKLAADYMLDQRDTRGLVMARADGHEVWGIASWRNVIPGYQINGAVTEINSECCAALRLIADVCDVMHEPEEGARFREASNDLKIAINQHLLNPVSGMYYLNIDSSGMPHTDVTTDEVFPVLFDVAPPHIANRIVSRLRADDFMTTAGLRTVSRNSPDYEPTTLIGLKGGVWPGVAFWYAFAAAKTNPEFMVDAMQGSYLQYLTDPRKNNTVPGQFSEWFDGESLVNRGMRLSPWEPPRLLWAAVEGLCGAVPRPDGCKVAPTRPPSWKWLALRRAPISAGYLTYFATFEEKGVTIYSNEPVTTPHDLHVAGKDVTNKVKLNDYRVHRAAFLKDGEVTICLGTESSVYVTAVVTLEGILEHQRTYDVRIYGSASGWVDLGSNVGRDLTEIAISIEDGEFRIIVMTPK